MLTDRRQLDLIALLCCIGLISAGVVIGLSLATMLGVC